MKVFLNLLLW